MGTLTENFSVYEVECRCRRSDCEAGLPRRRALLALQMTRDILGEPMKLNSGIRCSFWNAAWGGSPQSQHLKGLAFDVEIKNQSHGDRVEKAALQAGAKGIGRYTNFIHLDWRERGEGVARWDEREKVWPRKG